MAGQRDLAADFPPGGNSTIRLFKDDVLCVGSYGKVCRAERDHLRCAAKIMHETLFDPTATARQRPLTPHEQHIVGRTPFERFRQECEILRNLRHPNIIQYLDTYRDPDTRLPVLLMELMEESLTHYLEEQQDVDVPYHVQVNICDDVTLALTFLHANNIVHRDLSSNNVLLSGLPGNIRAKVTDFGMASLVVGAGMAVQDHSYSLTTCPGATVYMLPEAVQDNPIYTNKVDCFSFGVLIIQILTRQFPSPGDRYVQVRDIDPQNTHHQRTLVEVISETDRRQNHISQINPNHPLLAAALDCLCDRELERPAARELRERMDLLKQSRAYVDSMQQNPPRIDRQNQPHLRPRRVQQDIHQLHCERLDTHRAVRLQREPTAVPDVADAQAMRLNWNRGNSAPCEMYRWCDAVVEEGVVYFRQAGLNNLHVNYYSIANRCWNELPRCPLGHPAFIVIDGQLTGIGDKSPISNQLFTLQQTGRSQQWVTAYPPMPTRRYLTTALCTETALIVAGGVGEGNRLLTTVEVMQRDNQEWSTTASLPLPLTRCSVTLLDGHIYLLGGLTVNESSRRVLSCSLRNLLDSCCLQSASGRGGRVRDCNVWNPLTDLPVYDSTCVSFCGSLLAIGGRDEQYRPTSAVHIYIPATNV